MILKQPLLSMEDGSYSYLFNVYVYRNHLIGIEEDPRYLQIYEMTQFGAISDYFDWRRTETGFGSLLDINGYPIFKTHPRHRLYRGWLSSAEEHFHVLTREWGNRLRK